MTSYVYVTKIYLSNLAPVVKKNDYLLNFLFLEIMCVKFQRKRNFLSKSMRGHRGFLLKVQYVLHRDVSFAGSYRAFIPFNMPCCSKELKFSSCVLDFSIHFVNLQFAPNTFKFVRKRLLKNHTKFVPF